MVTLDALCWIVSVMVSLKVSMSSKSCNVSNWLHNSSWNLTFFDRIYAASTLNNIGINILHMSGHVAITCTHARPPNTHVTTTSRSYKHISTAAMCEDIRSFLLSKHVPKDAKYSVDMYIGAIINKYAPLATNTVTVQPHTQWYNDSIRLQKCAIHQLERRWRISRLDNDKLTY